MILPVGIGGVLKSTNKPINFTNRLVHIKVNSQSTATYIIQTLNKFINQNNSFMKNLTYKISMLVLGLFFTAFAANAQQIKGVVTDTNGEPQIGVSIFVEGTTLGVAS